MTILCLPGGSVTFFWANILILLRTTSMPLQFTQVVIVIDRQNPQQSLAALLASYQPLLLTDW